MDYSQDQKRLVAVEERTVHNPRHDLHIVYVYGMWYTM